MQRTIEKIHQLDFLLIFFFIFWSLSRKKQPHHRTAYSPGARCYPSLFFYLPIIYLYLYAQYHKLCISINHHTLLPSNHKHHRIRHHNPCLLYTSFQCLREDSPMPVDVYDAASWMAITALSEMSVARGCLLYTSRCV